MLLKIIKHEASSQRKERLQEKLSHAAQTFLAKNALLRDQNRFLTKINDESKARRATKSTILGKARVMTWEDLEEARKKDAEKKAKKAAKKAREATTGKKRGRPQKSAMTDITEPKAKVARMSATQEGEAGPSKPNIVQRIDVQVEEVELMPRPWRAPVARMY